jgi:arylformamidase
VIAKIEFPDATITVDLNKPIDISIPLRAGTENVNAWYVNPMRIEAVRTDNFLGSVSEGGNVNFRDIFFNPHGNGTHTECVGHISEEIYSVNDAISRNFFSAELITVSPNTWDSDDEWRSKGDLIIEASQLTEVLNKKPEALIIRTLPNSDEKLNIQYSNTNPPFLCDAAAKAIREAGVKHVLIDLPSVDREHDGGKMLSHRAFWNYPQAPRLDATISELIYVRKGVEDGRYLLEIQLAPFVNDASPSKPTLYEIH